MRDFFDGVILIVDWQKFHSDNVLREGFNEAVSKGIIAFSLFDNLNYANSCKVVVKYGTLFIQSTPEHYGVNIGDTAQRLIDQLVER